MSNTKKTGSILLNFTPTKSSSAAPASAAASASAASAAPANLSGSSPRDSEGIYRDRENNTRLLSVPASAAAAISSTAALSAASPKGSSFIRYLIILLIILFLGLNLFLYLEKPVYKSISHLYDPLFKFFGIEVNDKKDIAVVNNNAAIKKLEKTLNEKKVINKIDNNFPEADNDKNVNVNATADNASKPEQYIKKNYKGKLVVIPEADDSTSRTQMKPQSKAGFCYIGEDRGFRSCIEVGEGDVCMSGDIFPTNEICINPKLRE